jgi:hypothetical protein
MSSTRQTAARSVLVALGVLTALGVRAEEPPREGARDLTVTSEEADRARTTDAATVRKAGQIVAVESNLVVVELGDEPAVGPGTVLQVFRRFPGGAGTAEFRRSSPWYAVGELTVDAVEGRVAVARQTAGPPRPLPALFEESGAPPEFVHIGDRVRTSGAVAARPLDVRVTFARDDLFRPGDVELSSDGERLLGQWVRGLRGLDGPVEVQVVVRQAGGGSPAAIDQARAASVVRDAPLGPVVGTDVVPVENLYDDPEAPRPVPPGREVHVVQTKGRSGLANYRYLDPITLAEHHGRRVAEAIRSQLRLPEETVLVRVLPRGTATEDGALLPGYDSPGDQVRILSTGIRWQEARPASPAAKKPEDDPKARAQEAVERALAPVSAAPGERGGDGSAAASEPKSKGHGAGH